MSVTKFVLQTVQTVQFKLFTDERQSKIARISRRYQLRAVSDFWALRLNRFEDLQAALSVLVSNEGHLQYYEDIFPSLRSEEAVASNLGYWVLWFVTPGLRMTNLVGKHALCAPIASRRSLYEGRVLESKEALQRQ